MSFSFRNNGSSTHSTVVRSDNIFIFQNPGSTTYDWVVDARGAISECCTIIIAKKPRHLTCAFMW